MTVDEFDFILIDRIEKIKAINAQYDLLNNSYIAFSGGKDSCVLSKLIDLALPNNNIPRIYANTGIEYSLMVKFVKRLAEHDKRIIIVNQKRNIKKTLDEFGYPFKSKMHSYLVDKFNKGIAPNTTFAYANGLNINVKLNCPKSLKYQFSERGLFHYSDNCCYLLKKELFPDNMISLTGMRRDEGGNREHLNCVIFDKGKLKKFHPLVVCSEEWENFFIDKYHIQLCDLYYPPYNMKRTGCKGCPFDINLQDDLDMMSQYLPNERKQCELIWKPVYDEYRRIGYRLNKNFNIFDFLY